MSCCINANALLSGLVLRADRDGYEPTVDDFLAVLGAGCAPPAALAAVERLPADRAGKMRATVEAAIARLAASAAM
jgi:hypothetical protein